jgi:hypothetical protein
VVRQGYKLPGAAAQPHGPPSRSRSFAAVAHGPASDTVNLEDPLALSALVDPNEPRPGVPSQGSRVTHTAGDSHAWPSLEVEIGERSGQKDWVVCVRGPEVGLAVAPGLLAVVVVEFDLAALEQLAVVVAAAKVAGFETKPRRVGPWAAVELDLTVLPCGRA